jgi:hypothetical protein
MFLIWMNILILNIDKLKKIDLYLFKLVVIVIVSSFIVSLPLTGSLNFIFSDNLRQIDYFMLGTAFQSILLYILYALVKKD